jgi:hypothetical protein
VILLKRIKSILALFKNGAWAWERRALRAEDTLKPYQAGLMERTGEAKLEDTLSFLLNEDSGKMDEREVDPGQWEREHLIRCEAMAGRPNDSWIVIKVPQSNRTHVLCDFCDGDECDAKQWLEGPYKRDMIRARRRACSDNLFAAKSLSQAPVLS